MSEPLIAVVDDDPRVLASLRELLESAGYVAETFESAEGLLSRGLKGIGVVITDIGMPGADGFDLRDAVRQIRPDLPVFLITGRHEINDQSGARGRGGFLRKPFDGNALLAALRDALESQ
jgi:FixJ family two-component response regulator